MGYISKVQEGCCLGYSTLKGTEIGLQIRVVQLHIVTLPGKMEWCVSGAGCATNQFHVVSFDAHLAHRFLNDPWFWILICEYYIEKILLRLQNYRK